MISIQHVASTLLRGWLPACLLVWGSVSLGLCLLPQRIRALRQPWPICIAAALGSQLVGIVTLVLGTRGLVSPPALLAFLIVPLGLCCWLALDRIGGVLCSFRIWWQLPTTYRIMAVMCVGSYALMGVIASTPPSKHDDLWYHLVLAKRTVIEGEMRFYPSPFTLALPQQSYPSSLLSLLTFGQPSATLAFGVLWSLLFAWCFWERVRQLSPRRAAIGTTILVCAFGNLLWWTSASSSVLAAFVSTFFALWVVERDDLRSRLGIREYFGVAGALAAALCVAKISFLAPAGLLLCAACYDEWRRDRSLHTLLTVSLSIAIPMVLLYGPWLWWTYAATGNPFGIAALSLFGSTMFDRSRVHDMTEAVRQVNQFRLPWIDDQPVVLRPLAGIVGALGEDLSLKQTHLLHLAVAFVAGPLALIRRGQWAVLVAAVAGSFVLGIFVTHDLRFHSIVIYGFLLVAVLWYRPRRSITLARLVPVMTVALGIPTLAAGVYYSLSFMPNAVGLQTDEEFLGRYTGLYTAIQWCNANLPGTVRLCLDVHALPRAFYFNRLALAPEHLTKQEVADNFDLPAYMLRNGLSYLVSTNGDHASTGRFVLTKRFDNCILEGLRTPGARPVAGTIYVYRLAADER